MSAESFITKSHDQVPTYYLNVLQCESWGETLSLPPKILASSSVLITRMLLHILLLIHNVYTRPDTKYLLNEMNGKLTFEMKYKNKCLSLTNICGFFHIQTFLKKVEKTVTLNTLAYFLIFAKSKLIQTNSIAVLELIRMLNSLLSHSTRLLLYQCKTLNVPTTP